MASAVALPTCPLKAFEPWAATQRIGFATGGAAVLRQPLEVTEEEEAQQRQDRQADAKAALRKAYGIGWRPEAFARSSHAAARRLGLFEHQYEQGVHASCCIALDERTASATLTSSSPEATSSSVHPEYLAICLRVRREHGREVLFSLDPMPSRGPREASHRMQKKRFEPSWLAETSVGELLFQADYHLKELSMGEHDQPVVGMQSCLDMLAAGADEQWIGREWFVVREAEVQLRDGNVLTPFVRLGVEAREQVLEANGHCVDCPITESSHPLVQYATSFTQFFDLIAERRSVFFHLRELAKASVLAKHLHTAGIHVQEKWSSLPPQGPVSGIAEVPQLWNERLFAQNSGQDSSAAVDKRIHGVYGGVQLALAKFDLSRVAAMRPTGLPGVERTTLAVGLGEPLIRPSLGLQSPLLESLARAATPQIFRTGVAREAPSLGRAVEYALRVGQPVRYEEAMGVDMNLQDFNLSTPSSLQPGEAEGSPAPHDLECLKKRIFNPKLCDRLEGDQAPPLDVITPGYLSGLVLLLQHEARLDASRK